MSDLIRLLPDSVANQIAAGEVIQRPASVIKELVENAVDAGATEIKIYLKDAGRTLIQVVDNGKGMSETDARMAFERHATSKIQAADDLFALHTMGFRGEALPSICAISQVELKTRTDDSTMGTRLVINGSKLDTQEPCMCDRGVNISVKNLFFNVPARRKFLKSDSVENSNVMREFERLALVNNNIRMSIDTGSKVIDLRAATMKQRIGDIWKNNLDLHLLPIDIDTSLIKITGFISRPEYARRRNPLQYLIVNGRNMRHPYFHKAIMSCYEPLIAPDTQPCYFLKFEVDPSSIDVNIHPTKNEIKFEYEQQIWPILQASVKAALGKFGAVPSIDFNSDVLPVEPLPTGESPDKPTLDIPVDYNPFKVECEADKSVNPFIPSFDESSPNKGRAHSRNDNGSYRGGDYAPRNWDSLYADFIRGSRGFSAEVRSDEGNVKKKSPVVVEEEVESPPLLPEMEDSAPVGDLCFQYAHKYIITSTMEGLIIIDQYRAHLRILFEQYMLRMRNNERVTQSVMFPETVTLDATLQAALSEVEETLARAGFTLENVKGEEWAITSAPSVLGNSGAGEVVVGILESVVEERGLSAGDVSAEDILLRRVALIMARSEAVRRGKKLSSDEMEHIVSELFSLPDSLYTPEGNLIYCRLDDSTLESMFK